MTDDSKTTITPERWHRASEIFADALDHDEGDPREAFLLRVCGDDHALLQRVTEQYFRQRAQSRASFS